MSTLIIKRENGDNLPRKTRVSIVTWPEMFPVWSGMASRSANVELDPGRYRTVVHKSSKDWQGKTVCFKEVKTILHDITAKQLKEMMNRPVRHISSGRKPEGIRWKCTWEGCSEDDMTSIIAARIHVLEEHMGEHPLRDEEPDPPAIDKPVTSTAAGENGKPEPPTRQKRRRVRRQGTAPTTE